MKRRTPTPAPNEAPGVIRPEELYRLDELSRRLRLGTVGLRTLRREHGLHVLRVSGRAYVRGDDAIEAIVRAGNGGE